MTSKEIKYLKIKKELGQIFVKFIKEEFKSQTLIDKSNKILKENDYILFPLIEDKHLINKLTKSLENIFEYQIILKEPIPSLKFEYKSLEDILKNEVSEDLIQYIPKSYDIIGDIAIIEFDRFSEYEKESINNFKKKIGEAITIANKNVKTVYEKTSEIKGKYRLRELTLIYGQNKSKTIHKENKCSFKLDVKKTFFTPRLVYERRRITMSNIKANELIIDLFAGVGPISIQIAKNHNVTIYSFDINPDAYKYLNENLTLNKLIGNIIPYNLDIKEILNPSNKLALMLKGKADRVIMNLPERSLDYVDIACFLMKKSGGIIYNYQFCEKPDPIEKAITNLKTNLMNLNWHVEKLLEAKTVKAYSPKSDLVVVESYIKLNE